MTKQINILRASSIGTHEPLSVIINVTEQIQDAGTLQQHRELFKDQAKGLADALFGSLPGGTMDELIAELMRRRASLFVVPLIVEEK